MGKQPWRVKPNEDEDSHINVLDFIDSNENSNLLDEMPTIPLLTAQDINSIIPSFTTSNGNDFLPDQLFDSDPKEELFPSDYDIEQSQFEPRIIQVTNFQDSDEANELVNVKAETPSDDDEQTAKEVEEEPYEVKYACKKSLFNSNSGPPEKYPWEIDFEAGQERVDDFAGDKKIELIGEYEENEIYKRLKAIFEASETQKIEIPHWIRRHYRKLCVRRMQRSFGRPVFSLDNFSKSKITHSMQSSSRANVLDRFHHLITASGNFTTGSKANESFMARLAGSCQYDLFISPHTERVLHPFIYRNDSCVPPWVKLLCELQYEVNGDVPSRASIDYCYVRPQHIAAVNALLQRMFWPGIDSKFITKIFPS